MLLGNLRELLLIGMVASNEAVNSSKASDMLALQSNSFLMNQQLRYKLGSV